MKAQSVLSNLNYRKWPHRCQTTAPCICVGRGVPRVIGLFASLVLLGFGSCSMCMATLRRAGETMGFLLRVLVLQHGKLRNHGLRLRPDLCSALGPSPSPSPSGELSCDFQFPLAKRGPSWTLSAPPTNPWVPTRPMGLMGQSLMAPMAPVGHISRMGPKVYSI